LLTKKKKHCTNIWGLIRKRHKEETLHNQSRQRIDGWMDGAPTKQQRKEPNGHPLKEPARQETQEPDHRSLL